MKQKLLVITGPTGVGKTNLVKEIYDKFNVRLISADSMQIYTGCDIGTAKLSSDELKNYPHALIDIKKPSEEYSVAQFKEDATIEINKATTEKLLPLIVGGTGLYIEGLLFPYNFQNNKGNDNIRKYYYDLAKTQGNMAVYDILLQKNPILAKDVHYNNLKRVIRLLENIESQPKLQQNQLEKESNFDYFIIFLTREREKLYEIINNRVDEMVNNNLVNEAKWIYDNYKDCQVANAIGYKEFFEYFDGNIDLETAINLVKQHSRNYAKRQITWFKRYKNICFIDIEKENPLNIITEKFGEYKK